MKKFLLVIIVLFCSCNKNEINLTKNKNEIIKLYNKIDRNNKVNSDSLVFFSQKIAQLSQNENIEFKAIAQVAKNMVDIDEGYYNLANKNCNELIKLLPSFKNDTIKGKFYLVFGFCKYNKGEFDLALKYNFKALNIYESCKNKNGIAIVNNKIADVYFAKNDTKSSVKYLNKTLSLLKSNPKSVIRMNTFHSLANIYGMSGNFANALKIDDACLKIAEKLNSNKIKVQFLDNKANCYMYSNKLDSAQFYFEKCLILDKLIGNPRQIADNYSNQAVFIFDEK